jgi:hypothetical protein
MEVRKWLRQQSKDFYVRVRQTSKAIGQVYQCWWKICREINVSSRFDYRICYVLYQSVTYLMTPL